MRFSDMAMSLLIIFIFTIGFSICVLLGKITEVKQNWPKYRCDPSVMPLAGFVGPQGTDTVSNFSECLANSSGDLIGAFLAPLKATSEATNVLGGSIMDSLQNVRKMGDFSNFMGGFMMEHMLTIFLTLMMRFQIIMMKIKTIVLKTLSIGFVVTYMFKSGSAGTESVKKTYLDPMRGILS